MNSIYYLLIVILILLIIIAFYNYKNKIVQKNNSKVEQGLVSFEFLIYSLIFLIGAVLIILMPNVLFHNKSWFGVCFKDTALMGDTIGGMTAPFIGLAVGALTFLAFWIQYKANEQQKKDLKIERFENKFYELLKLHKENVAEMDIAGNVIGRKCFIPMFTELRYVYTVVKNFNNSFVKDNKHKYLREDEIMNLAYHIFFYGVGLNSEKQYYYGLKVNEKYILDEVKEFIKQIQFKYKALENRGNVAKYPIEFDREGIPPLELKYSPFQGHANRLGHYYRHLLQTIEFIDIQDFLSEEDKYGYVKTLRAQLSNFEQLHIYYNAMAWFIKKWRPLIVSYHFLKNLPVGLADFHILPKEEFEKEIEITNMNGNCLFEAYQNNLN